MKVLVYIFVLVLSSGYCVARPDTDDDEQEFGSSLKIMREIDVTNDSVPEVLRIETTSAKRFEDIKVKLTITSGGKRIYNDEWKADDYFDARDTTKDVEKWYRLQRILNDYFANENFPSTADSTAHCRSLPQPRRAVQERPSGRYFSGISGSRGVCFCASSRCPYLCRER
jgi:hypothetical protein